MDFYKIRTLDASVILAEGKKKKDSYTFDINFDDVALKSDAILKVENHADCALFRQVRMAAGLKCEDEQDPRDIFYDLVYMDFSKVFKRPNAGSKRDEALMKNGFKLKEPGQKERTFYPFDRSASMSKSGLITFISGDLYDDVDERIRLGIDFDEIEVFPSKYFAYRGLYLSDGRAISHQCLDKVLRLNKETVIVIDDDTTEARADVVTCTLRYDKDGNLLKNDAGKLPLTNDDGSVTVIKDKTIDINSFDGEGIISKEYAELINDELFSNRAHAYSFQIRMPYVKGVLHMVDFKEFVKEQLGREDLKGITIKDCFKRYRDLSKAEIILTKSMFKGKEWIETAAAKLDPMEFYFDMFKRKEWIETADAKLDPMEFYFDMFKGKEWIETADAKLDPMEFYFERFKRYQHTLYITNTSLGFGVNNEIPLGYQFLNTLEIEGKELKKLLNKHYKAARELSEDVEHARKKLIGRAASDIDDEGDLESLDLPAWKYALLQNKAFIYDKYIKKYSLEKMSDHMRDEGRIGRIDVGGIVGFLSRDLLAFMVCFMKKLEGVSTDDAVKRIEKECMDKDHFYMAEHHKKLKKDQCYGILRNPHLSRNEQCALKALSPDRKSLYKRYFGDLTGVIMIPYGSVAHDVLGGADFDGDTVKLFTEKIINDAILRGAYKDGDLHKRKYPIAKIPSPKGDKRDKQIVKNGKGDMVEFDHIRKVFANKIGHISNASLMIAKYEYIDKKAGYENWSALCTIATGLEIDSVKTGVRPDLSEIEKHMGNEPDMFLAIKYKKNDQEDEAEDDQENGVADDGKNKKEAYHYPKLEEYGFRPIDYLEYYYQEEMSAKKKREKEEREKKEKNKSGRKGPTPKEARRMMFVDEFTQQKPDKTDCRIELIKRIHGSYDEFCERLKELESKMINVDTAHCVSRVKFILNTKYDQDVEKLPRSGVEINAAINKAIHECKRLFDDPKKAHRAYAKLYDNWNDWIFCEGYDNKKEKLADILGCDNDSLSENLSESTLEVLCDTYDNGYQILKHVLRYVRDEVDAVFDKRESIEALKKLDVLSDSVKKKYKGVDEELFVQMCDIYDIKESKSHWVKEATELIRKKLAVLFGGDMKSAAEFILINDKLIDKQHICLWNWFDVKEIQHLIKEA